jgi:hypothetical protein
MKKNCQLLTVNCKLKKNCQLSTVNCQLKKTVNSKKTNNTHAPHGHRGANADDDFHDNACGRGSPAAYLRYKN